MQYNSEIQRVMTYIYFALDISIVTFKKRKNKK